MYYIKSKNINIIQDTREIVEFQLVLQPTYEYIRICKSICYDRAKSEALTLDNNKRPVKTLLLTTYY